MDAVALLRDRAKVATRRLQAYAIVPVRGAHQVYFRVVKHSITGESLMCRRDTREAAEEWLLTRLPAPERTRADA